MRGKSVAQRMRTKGFGEASSSGSRMNGIARPIACQGSAGDLAWKQPGYWSDAAPIVPQEFEQFRRQHHVSVLGSLAELNPNRHALAVNVADAQVNGFTDAHAGSIQGSDQHMMRKTGSGLQQRQHFRRAENDRKLLRLLGCRDQLDGPLPVQGNFIKKTQGTDRNNPGADRGLLLLG
jgi:hypothetical protein